VRFPPEVGYSPIGGAGRPVTNGGVSHRDGGPGGKDEVLRHLGGRSALVGASKAFPGEGLADGAQKCDPSGGESGNLLWVIPEWDARRTCPAAKASRTGDALADGGENRPTRNSRRTATAKVVCRSNRGGMDSSRGDGTATGNGTVSYFKSRAKMESAPATALIYRKPPPGPVCAGTEAQKDP
jgi:hypothetical protein